ncbi:MULTISPECIES: 5-oxoprolinase subunit PxpB [Bradyrhizobium]|uniref:5-oxoprolinase subunit PxpB n=1 Tax=Bradyrhizobium TaxID=374 RepID=UPI00040B0597|nr:MULTISPECIES: 5-oxoprolinase subunit PxpB [Bradyrhizobium]QOG20887.1 5-oxoprolinase subunit PxpB [Bradyrhizobium sp. SEMIA]UFW51531.1 5-oxoprolinase subunit PxpB [Bradyrhizobium arachidis]
MTTDRPRTSLLGTTALLFEAPGETTLETQRRIWAMARAAAGFSGVREAVPGMNNLMLAFVEPPRRPEEIEQRLVELWDVVEPLPIAGHCIDLPVTYGGEAGPHMADVVEHTGMSIDEIVERHSAPTYTVFALGSHPGYCYLGGMDERIATPRRKVPVLRIPGGAVSIGGNQTGVSASVGPSGWNTIGSTQVAFFDVNRSPPALLQPGDSIRFRVVRVLR